MKTRTFLRTESKHPIKTIQENFGQIVFLKAFISTSQSETNACNGPHNCSHICVGAPGGAYSYLCPNGMNASRSGECVHKPNAGNSTIPIATCGPFKFRCNNGQCIESAFTCGGWWSFHEMPVINSMKPIYTKTSPKSIIFCQLFNCQMKKMNVLTALMKYS